METNEILEIVRKKVLEDTSGRRALSLRYPLFLPLILGTRRFANNLANSINTNLTSKKAVGNKSQAFFDCVIARHSSPLFRKLGDFDQDLLTGKVENLKIAIDALQGTIIYPNEIFSFWHIVGDTTKKKGYVDGMLLSDGKIVRGIGGGLCQLSNLLYWLFLHSSVEIVERMHHSRDVFPDNERTIPFGSGATIFYNLIDLKVRNTSKYPIQLKLWLSESQLKGQILSTHFQEEKYHIREKNPYFVQTSNGVYRYNEIWREALIGGQVVREEKVVTNCALVMYKPKCDTLLLYGEQI